MFAKWPSRSLPPRRRPLPAPFRGALWPAGGRAGGGGGAEPWPVPQFLCTVVAIALHYLYMSTFAWTFVESLHVYRMLAEARNIDAGPMRFYYVLGWGLPAIVTGEGAGGRGPDCLWGPTGHR